MVWGCFAESGVGSLVFIRGIMNADKCIDILREHLRSSAEKLVIFETFYLYQDNDSKYKAYKMKSWLLYNCPGVMHTPPQSPDCNPIENSWEYVDSQVRQHTILSRVELQKILRYKIPVSYLKN